MAILFVPSFCFAGAHVQQGTNHAAAGVGFYEDADHVGTDPELTYDSAGDNLTVSTITLSDLELSGDANITATGNWTIFSPNGLPTVQFANNNAGAFGLFGFAVSATRSGPTDGAAGRFQVDNSTGIFASSSIGTGLHAHSSGGIAIEVSAGSVTLRNITASSTLCLDAAFSVIPCLAITPPSKTLAQLQALVPTGVGQSYYCSNCATDAVCVSTGTGTGAFVRMSARGTACQ